MKKLIAALTAVLCLGLLLPSCASKKKEDVQPSFRASVMEVYDGSVLVSCTESEFDAVPVGSEVSVGTDPDISPVLAVGDRIEVIFDGVVMESWPLQLGTIYAINLLEKS